MNKSFLEFIGYLIFLTIGTGILVFSVIQNIEHIWTTQQMASGIFVGCIVLSITVYFIVTK